MKINLTFVHGISLEYNLRVSPSAVDFYFRR